MAIKCKTCKSCLTIYTQTETDKVQEKIMYTIFTDT